MTSYHLQCDRMIERFNRTLKTMLRKHEDVVGKQWDKFPPRVLWSYRTHNSTGQKPSFLLFVIDCRSPTEAAYLKSADIYPIDIDNYWEELQVSVTSAQKLAAATIQKVQKKQKSVMTKRSTGMNHHLKQDKGFWQIFHKTILDLTVNYQGHGMDRTE